MPNAPLNSSDVVDVLVDLCLSHGTSVHVRSDQGPEYIAWAAKTRIAGIGGGTAYIEKARSWENWGNWYVKSFNGKLRDELLSGEAFNTPLEAQVFIEGHCNRVRRHSSLECAAQPHPPPQRLSHAVAARVHRCAVSNPSRMSGLMGAIPPPQSRVRSGEAHSSRIHHHTGAGGDNGRKPRE